MNVTKEPAAGVGIIDVQRFSSVSKLNRVTARLLKAAKLKSFRGIFDAPTPEEVQRAETEWVKHVQKDLGKWDKDFQRLGPVERDGVVMVGTRMESWMKNNWNIELLILFPYHHQYTRLYVRSIHEINHGGIDSTLGKVLRHAWVPKLRKLFRTFDRFFTFD